LLRADAAEIARAEYALAVHDLERTEDPDDWARTCGVVGEQLHLQCQRLS
jgi:hypothetical protein